MKIQEKLSTDNPTKTFKSDYHNDNDLNLREYNALKLSDSKNNFYIYDIHDFKNYTKFYDCQNIWRNAEFCSDSDFPITSENIEFKRTFLFVEDNLLILLSKDYIHIINMQVNKKFIERFMFDDISNIILIHRINTDALGIFFFNTDRLLIIFI